MLKGLKSGSVNSLQNGAITQRGYISEKTALLQSGVGMINWAKSYYKVGQLVYYKVSQSLHCKVEYVLSSRATLLQSGAGIISGATKGQTNGNPCLLTGANAV